MTAVTRGRLQWTVVAGLTVVAALAPLGLNTYWLRVLSGVLLYAVLASALNLVAGYTGYPAFGNVVFFGLGAYATAIAMTRLGSSFWVGLALGVLVCASFAVVIGLPVLRLRGHYFAVATLGMNEATRRLVENFSPLTGGGMGLSLPIARGDVRAVNAWVYWLLLGLLVAVLAFTAWFRTSRLGYGCRAIRFDEEGAMSCGVPAMRYKVAVWAVSAVFTGLAGGIYAHWFGYIEPPVVFDMTIAVKCFVMMLIGGTATVFGPVYGAILIEALGLAAWSQLLTYHSAMLGVLIMAVVVFAPGGLTSLAAQRLSVHTLLANIRASRV